MLFSPYLSRHSFAVDNYGASPTSTPGTSVTPGASNAEGSWTQVLGALAQDVYGFSILVSGGLSGGAIKSQLLDVGVDPAGGTSYSAIISNIVMGSSNAGAAGGGQCFFFPMFIKAGSTVAVRIQGSNATAGTVTVGMRAYGQRSRPEAMPVGTYSDTIGTITNSSGVAFTPGNAADGTWVSLGATTRPLWWWQIGHQVDNGTLNLEGTFIEIAHGDGSNKHIIMRVFHIQQTSEAIVNANYGTMTPYEAYCPVKTGETIYIRGRCQNAPDSGYNGVAIGVGG